MHKSKIAVLTARLYIKLAKRHHEPPVLLYFNGFTGWLAWFSLQIFCLNNEIHFSLANANNSASFKRKMVWKWRFLLIHKQQTNLWMKLPTILPGLAGKIVKYRPLSEPIRLQDLEDSARSQTWKKIMCYINNNNSKTIRPVRDIYTTSPHTIMSIWSDLLGSFNNDNAIGQLLSLVLLLLIYRFSQG